jgi:glutamine amidotransferase
MFGTASNNKISPLWLEEFHRLSVQGNILKEMGEGHGDGWGIAGYLGNWTVHFGRSSGSASKEIKAYESAAMKAVAAKSKIVIAHFRKASEGRISIENSHPFINGEWIFCHNGTIEEADKIELNGCVYEGSTDSERVFMNLAAKLKNRKVEEYPAIIKDEVARIKAVCKCTSLTFLMANGRYLIGLRDFTEDEDYYTLYCSYSENHSITLCSEPLPGFDWRLMDNGELIIADREGGIVYGI